MLRSKSIIQSKYSNINKQKQNSTVMENCALVPLKLKGENKKNSVLIRKLKSDFNIIFLRLSLRGPLSKSPTYSHLRAATSQKRLLSQFPLSLLMFLSPIPLPISLTLNF